MANDTARAYKPDPAHVQILGVDPGAGDDATAWYIQLSADATVVELALLMATFNCSAELITEELLRLSPTHPDLPCPTGDEVRELFERGLSGALRNPLRYIADKPPPSKPAPVPILENHDPQKILGWVDFSGRKPIIHIDRRIKLQREHLFKIFGGLGMLVLETEHWTDPQTSQQYDCVIRAEVCEWSLVP